MLVYILSWVAFIFISSNLSSNHTTDHMVSYPCKCLLSCHALNALSDFVFPEKSMENDEFPPADGVDRCRTVLVSQCRCCVLYIWDQPNVQPTCTGTSRKGIWSGDKMVGRCFFLFPFFSLMDSDSENETSPPALLGVGHHFPHSLPPGVSLSILLHQGGPQDCRILYSAHLPCCSLQPSPNLRQGLQSD